MEIVIKIPEDEYNIAKYGQYGNINVDVVRKAIADGTPLPKSHGRLGDLDALEKAIINGIKAGNYEEGYEEYPHINDMDDIIECIKYADSVQPKTDVLDKIRAEIAEYGSIMVAYAITEDTKTDKGIEKLVSDVLSEAKRQVLDIIDKYKAESEE